MPLWGSSCGSWAPGCLPIARMFPINQAARPGAGREPGDAAERAGAGRVTRRSGWAGRIRAAVSSGVPAGPGRAASWDRGALHQDAGDVGVLVEPVAGAHPVVAV